jgi:Tol biopolymer transport system component
MNKRDGSPANADEARTATPAPELVRTQLARMLASRTFANAPSLSRFLAHIVEHTLQGHVDGLKEYAVGVDVFDRGPSFDPKTDTIVRVQARRLRAKVDEYYETEGRDDAVLITLEKGHYAPEFGIRRRDVLAFRPGLADVKAGSRITDVPPTRVRPLRASSLAAALAVFTAVGAGAWWLMRPAAGRSVTFPSEYTALTDFTDSVTAPTLSPDGRMVTFIRGDEWFLSRGQIYVMLLAGGEPRPLTNSPNLKFSPVFSHDGSRVAYSQVDQGGNWNTWTVPVLGGEPTSFLPNATGLVWLDQRSVMFSEYKAPAPHMGVVTTTESRAERREVYFPVHPRGMAHLSWASPDRRWILVVEMNRTGSFGRCRLVPFNGTSGERLVGPEGKCTAAAWSPDGKWMYFSAEVGRQSHLWRERLSGGAPEQITSGPTDEEGVAVAPDGRSIITAIGQRQSAIWIHDDKGDRALTREGFAFAPRLSADNRRVYFLLRPTPDSPASELRSIDLDTLKERRLLDGVVREHDAQAPQYDISKDEQEVVYAKKTASGESEIWLARLDRSTAPRFIARNAAFPSFGAGDDLFFVALEERSSALVRTRKEGGERQQVPHYSPLVNRAGITPDGKWAVVFAPEQNGGGTGTLAVPVDGGTPRKICARLCWAWWSADGTQMWVNIYDPARTLVIPLKPGRLLPDFPPEGIDHVTEEDHTIPGLKVIRHMIAAPVSNTGAYVFERAQVQRNLYRVPLH